MLKALGIDVDASREVQAACLDEVGICFCFAIHHHPATGEPVSEMAIASALDVPLLLMVYLAADDNDALPLPLQEKLSRAALAAGEE